MKTGTIVDVGSEFIPTFFKNLRLNNYFMRWSIGKYHTDKDISKAISEAVKAGWIWELSKGHPAGILKCTHKNKCHRMSVPSTPIPSKRLWWAKRIRKAVKQCK